ncbi:MAG: hypothetical protein ACYC44_00060 [Patescibacteria group bacterium]
MKESVITKYWRKLAGSAVLMTLILGLGLALSPNAAFAQAGLQSIKSGVQGAAKGAGLATSAGSDLSTVVGGLIFAVMSLVGIILFAYMVYGGFKWMTAGGDSKAVTEAQSIIRNAVIGIVIIALAYVISNYILQALINASNPTVQTVPATQ